MKGILAALAFLALSCAALASMPDLSPEQVPPSTFTSTTTGSPIPSLQPEARVDPMEKPVLFGIITLAAVVIALILLPRRRAP